MGCADGRGGGVRLGLVAVVGILSAGSSSLAATLNAVVVSPGSPVAVRIELNAASVANAHMLGGDAAHPPRLMIDLPDVTLGPGAPRTVDGSGAVLRVRTGQFSATTARVVFDMREVVPFDVHTEDRTVVVTLGSGGEARSPEPPPPSQGPSGQGTMDRPKGWGRSDYDGPVASAPSTRPAPSPPPGSPAAKPAPPEPANKPSLFLDYEGLTPLLAPKKH